MDIKIKKEEETQDTWKFLVVVGSENDKTEHSVILDRDYWEKLTSGKREPEELVKKSFEFLLEREPKESILREFNLRVINDYFPQYESLISARGGSASG